MAQKQFFTVAQKPWKGDTKSALGKDALFHSALEGRLPPGVQRPHIIIFQRSPFFTLHSALSTLEVRPGTPLGFGAVRLSFCRFLFVGTWCEVALTPENPIIRAVRCSHHQFVR